MSRSSSSSSYRGANWTQGPASLSARSYRTSSCRPTLPTLLASPTTLSSQYFDLGKTDSSCPTCKSQVTTPYYSKYLEGKITSIQEEHEKVVTENENLNNQLAALAVQNDELKDKSAGLAVRNRELEDKSVGLEKALQLLKRKEKSEPGPKRENKQTSVDLQGEKHVPTLTSNRGTNTSQTFLQKPRAKDTAASTDNPKKYERQVQTSPEKEKTCGPLCSVTVPQDFVSISKSELESLEADMRLLRDAVRGKEELWEQAASREQHYREQLARLSVELITARQLADSRHNEIQTFITKLAEVKEELRASQKDLAFTKRSLLKLKKSQRTNEDVGHEEASIENKEENLQNFKEKQRFVSVNGKQSDSQPTSPSVKQKFKASSAKSVRIAQ